MFCSKFKGAVGTNVSMVPCQTKPLIQKSRIRETLNLSTDADCSTNTMRGLGSDDVTCVGRIVS